MGENVLHNKANRGKMLTVRDGWLRCPNCRKNNRLQRILPDTSARRVQVFCRICKAEIIVDIDKGECFESHGQ